MPDDMPPEWNEEDLYAWINFGSAPADKRRFLEDHPALVDSRSATVLELEMEAWADEPDTVDMLRAHLEVITEALARGGDPRQASKEAFVRRFDALALDMPDWLEQILDPPPGQFAAMTPEERIRTVRAAIERVQAEPLADKDIILADLGLLLIDLQPLSESNESALYDEVIQISQAACASYPAPVYPKQHAMAEVYLGNALAHHPTRPAYDGAIHAFTRALDSMISDEPPELRASVQKELAEAYLQSATIPPEEKIAGGLAAAEAALDVFTEDGFPEDWASLQVTLGNLYHERIAEGRGENIERAITAYQNSLRVFTEEAYPDEFAVVQGNLGGILQERIEGHPLFNPENALLAYTAALRIYSRDKVRYEKEYAATLYGMGGVWLKRYTLPKGAACEAAIGYFNEALTILTIEKYPELHAMVQNALGVAYGDTPDDPYNNTEHAISAYQAALSVYASHNYPNDHDDRGNALGNLGNAYVKRKAGERTQNLRDAIACFDAALRLHRQAEYPLKHRRHLLDKALALAELGDWAAVHQAYQAALAIEEQLLRREVGEEARATLLREGRDGAVRDGYALAQLDRPDEAAVSIERGRAKGLAEMFMLDAADPERITDRDRRARFIAARERFTLARAALYSGKRPTTDLASALFEGLQPDRSRVRGAEAERATAFQNAQDALDAIVAEIRRAGDPGDFLQDSLDAEAILRAAQACGPDHALVYLAATPWGGLAVGAFAANPRTGADARMASRNLPGLTHDLVMDMTMTNLSEGYIEMVGGFANAQYADALMLLELPMWTQGRLDATFRQRAQRLYDVCVGAGRPSTLSAAAQIALTAPDLRDIVDRPRINLNDTELDALDATVNHCFLEEELQTCLPKLASLAMRPLAAWLEQEGASSVTLIPCGYLESYPLAAISLADGRTFAEAIATSIAPSAQSLRFEQPADFGRKGVYTFGNPDSGPGSLPWSEAEALTVSKLAKRRNMPHKSYVQENATHTRLSDVLTHAAVVDASCHGSFDTLDFLHSGILLSGGQTLTLADLLSTPGHLRGLRLLILSACQTAIPDARRRTDEVRSIAAAAVQAGVRAVMAALWPVHDRATFILVVRFMQEWLPEIDHEPPALALRRAQKWLRTATNREILTWRTATLPQLRAEELKEAGVRSGYISPSGDTSPWERATFASAGEPQAPLTIRIRGSGTRYTISRAEQEVHNFADSSAADAIPYADPTYWAGLQIVGW